MSCKKNWICLLFLLILLIVAVFFLYGRKTGEKEQPTDGMLVEHRSEGNEDIFEA